jgi:hypothetical protein
MMIIVIRTKPVFQPTSYQSLATRHRHLVIVPFQANQSKAERASERARKQASKEKSGVEELLLRTQAKGSSHRRGLRSFARAGCAIPGKLCWMDEKGPFSSFFFWTLDEKTNLFMLPKRMTNNNEDTSCRRHWGQEWTESLRQRCLTSPAPHPSEPAATSVPGRMDGWYVVRKQFSVGF